jgi:hypothetical protein
VTYDSWKARNPADATLGPEPAFTCPRCGRTSHNINDVQERYCGNCHLFIEEELMEDLYLIWSNEHRGWWRSGGWGYTPNLAEAGRFSREKAIETCRNAIMSSVQVGVVAELPVRVADVDEFLAKQAVPSAIWHHPMRFTDA